MQYGWKDAHLLNVRHVLLDGGLHVRHEVDAKSAQRACGAAIDDLRRGRDGDDGEEDREKLHFFGR